MNVTPITMEIDSSYFVMDSILWICREIVANDNQVLLIKTIENMKSHPDTFIDTNDFPTAEQKKYEHCRTLLHLAIECENAEAVEVLLRKGASASFVDAERKTPLYRAAAANSERIVRTLFQHDATIIESNRTILHELCCYTTAVDPKIISTLLAYHVDLNARKDNKTALQFACALRKINWIHCFLQHKANMAIFEDFTLTPRQLNDSVWEAILPPKMEDLDFLLNFGLKQFAFDPKKLSFDPKQLPCDVDEIESLRTTCYDLWQKKQYPMTLTLLLLYRHLPTVQQVYYDVLAKNELSIWESNFAVIRVLYGSSNASFLLEATKDKKGLIIEVTQKTLRLMQQTTDDLVRRRSSSHIVSPDHKETEETEAKELLKKIKFVTRLDKEKKHKAPQEPEDSIEQLQKEMQRLETQCKQHEQKEEAHKKRVLALQKEEHRLQREMQEMQEQYKKLQQIFRQQQQTLQQMHEQEQKHREQMQKTKQRIAAAAQEGMRMLQSIAADRAPFDEFLSNIEGALKCPISLEIMQDPVTLPSGISFERQEIRTWTKKGKPDPCTRAKNNKNIDNLALQKISRLQQSLRSLLLPPSMLWRAQDTTAVSGYTAAIHQIIESPELTATIENMQDDFRRRIARDACRVLQSNLYELQQALRCPVEVDSALDSCTVWVLKGTMLVEQACKLCFALSDWKDPTKEKEHQHILFHVWEYKEREPLPLYDSHRIRDLVDLLGKKMSIGNVNWTLLQDANYIRNAANCSTKKQKMAQWFFQLSGAASNPNHRALLPGLIDENYDNALYLLSLTVQILGRCVKPQIQKNITIRIV